MEVLPTWVSLLIISMPPILLELIAGVYGCLNIHVFYHRSSNLNQNQNNLNPESIRYIRFICFSACDLLCGIPITLFYLYFNIKGLVPFPGLTIEHYKFSEIAQLPAAVWRATTLSELTFELNRWITVWAAFVFFAIFGFTEESRNNYRAMLQYVVRDLLSGITSRSSSNIESCVTSFFFLFSVLIYSNMLFRIVFHNSHGSREDDIPES